MQYQVKDPQGQLHIIEGPEGASPDEVLAQAQKIVPSSNDTSKMMSLAPRMAVEGLRDTALRMGRPALEYGGLTAGAVLGAPGGLATSIAGGGLGYAAGKQAGNILGQTLGNEPVQPLATQMTDTAKDVGRGAMYTAGGEALGAVVSPLLGGGIRGVRNLIGKVRAIRNAPQTLEDALGTAGEKFGTSETPSMIGNTARTGLESEQSANEALAQEFYGRVPKDVPVSTPRLSAKYQEIADELPPSLGNLIKKNIQIGDNPIRPNEVGTTNTKIFGKSMPDETPVIPHQHTASPGTPSQLPPNTPPVSELIKLRSKLGAAARSGGIDGYNAGQLKAALDEDIANLGSGEGPLGKMTNQAVNEPLKRATNYWREMRNQQGTPLFRKLSTGKTEDIPNMIFNKGRTQDVLESRALLGDEGFNATKKSFFNEIINSKDIGKALSKYSKNNSDFLSSVFNPEELNSLRTLSDLQQKAIQAAKTVDRVKMLITGASVAAVGGGIAGKAIKLGSGSIANGRN